MTTRTFTSPHPVDLRVTLAPLSYGRPDGSIRLAADAAVRAWHTPAGPATLALRQHGREFSAEAWGPGAAWALEQAPALAGCHDDAAGFAPGHALVARAHHRRPGLRFTRTGTVTEVLVPTILAQKVTGLEAARAWHAMIRAWGEPAPGPVPDLWLPPAAEVVAAQPYWAFHRFGVERKRAVTVIAACRRMTQLEAAVARPPGEAFRRLTAFPGIGPWTAGLVLRLARGDPDAVEVGDFHIPDQVAWNLAGEPRGDDARMLELLEPFRGHRGRVVRLLALEGRRAPAYGPRQPLRQLQRL
jgi:3-methyladenine DNA glycosylase/8-oxoguanine DNA glycosylase